MNRTRAKGGRRQGESDSETKGRLLEVATRLFAERGFAKVTVRDICAKAKANVAAVNYHFGGKTGLYDEVLRSAVRIMQATTREIEEMGTGKAPDEQLAIYVRVFLQRVRESRNGWIHQLMMHEMQDPTPALDVVVDGVIKPRLAYLASVIARLLGCKTGDRRVLMCVSSVQAQCMIAISNNPIGEKLGIPALTPEHLPAVAAHITAFSIAGIRAAAAQPAS
jgi:TetR/AcrR family transcriptional regulator, regulator of cefoperazone and chloramphenicol sensitivity